jgi:hypothetical protein
MSEIEFDRLVDAVRTAIAPAPLEDALSQMLTPDQLPKAANDNGQTYDDGQPWPFIPFPEGWNAAC